MSYELLKREIGEKLLHIRNDPETFDKRMTQTTNGLVNIADLYSFWIENPDLRQGMYLSSGERVGSKSPGNIRRLAQEGYRHITNAWQYLMSRSRVCDFVNSSFDVATLKGTNSLIHGRKAKEGKFREKDVTLNMPSFTPPGSNHIVGLVNSTVDTVKENYFPEPLDSSFYAHVALALIQPFDDGNKRTARLVQNRLLLDMGYPPIVIPAGEAKFYFDLLERCGVPLFKERRVIGSNDLYFYLASKVNNGLDAILGDLEVDSVDLLFGA